MFSSIFEVRSLESAVIDDFFRDSLLSVVP